MPLLVGTSRRLGCVPTRWRSNLSRWRQTLFHQNLSNATQRSVLRWVEMIIKIERLLVLFPARHSDCYYDYQLSKAQRSFVDQILTFNSCCCPGQLARFQWQLVDNWRRLQQSARKIENVDSCSLQHRNFKAKKSSPKRFFAPGSTDNRSRMWFGIAGKKKY